MDSGENCEKDIRKLGVRVRGWTGGEGSWWGAVMDRDKGNRIMKECKVTIPMNGSARFRSESDSCSDLCSCHAGSDWES